ncbi:MAG: Hydroxypyruvate reductase [Gammaproteobacteria bacterium]|nr:MAG: Hydroxypyruvate reductase [Gammaproteobacteria bacterium]
MNSSTRVAVCSRSFSKNRVLREELQERYSQVTFNNHGKKLEGDDLVEFLQGHDKAITALEILDRPVLVRLPELKVISKYGVGLDMIDLQAMADLGKSLGWKGGVNRRSVSELVIAFAISLLRRIPTAKREVLSGTWQQKNGGLLSGRTVGIIGCGNIGKDLVRLLVPWGCTILIHDILDYPDFYSEYNVTPVSLDDLLCEADVVTLHVPLDETTTLILDRQHLSMMKPSSILINAARGGLVDEDALKEMLVNGTLAGAAFDVFSTEPPEDRDLLSLDTFMVTPHIGGSSLEAILAMGRAAIDGLDDHDIPNSHQSV